MDGKAYGRERWEWTFTARCRATPEEVYDVLADLQTHLEWAGERQFRSFRLVSLDGPPGPASSGTVFRSTGRIPMSRDRFDNHNTVTKAQRPAVFEITTEAGIDRRRHPSGSGTFVNRFEIEPAPDGSRVTYRSRQLRFREPPWGLRYPLVRNVTYRVWIPFWSRRGFRNLVRMAEERAARPPASGNARGTEVA
jgi:hypothetical protein